MTTTFVKGDIFEDETKASAPRAFAFGADTSGALDQGIAVAFAKRWPAFATAFRAHCSGGKFQLGDVFAWRDGDDLVYALGLATNGKAATIGGLQRALGTLVQLVGEARLARVALPRLGGGKGGMDPTRVKRVLGEVGTSSVLSIVVYEQFVRSAGTPKTDGG